MTGRAIGVDLGGTNVRAALVDLGAARIEAERRAPVTARDPTSVAERIAALVAEVGGAELPVGVGIAGMLRGWTGVVANAPNLGWREVDFRALLAERLRSSVELYNDVNAVAYGEAAFGAARGARDVLTVFVGTGIGGGLVTDGRLYAGATHLAGEIGHTKVIPGGRPCGCGARGCVEAYASGSALARRAREDQGLLWHAGQIDEAARGGDAWALALWSEVAPLLGLTLANAVTLIDPECVVLGGGVWEGAPLFREQVIASYRALVNAPTGESARLVDSALGDQAGVLGAAALAGGALTSSARGS